MKTAKEICPTTTLNRVKDGALLVDVREMNEVEKLAFDVPEILNIPFSEFEEKFNEIPKNREIIMVCEVGSRSLKTTYFLMNHGWKNVSNMQYGLVRWVEKGFPYIGNPVVSGNGGGCCSPPAVNPIKKDNSCCAPKDDWGSCC